MTSFDQSPAIDARAVCKHYGRHAAVDGVSLAVHPGERLALLGHNGAGKTTLMKMVLGLTRPTGGALRVLGAEPARSAARIRHAIGFLPENVAFHESMTGWEVMRFYARLKGRGAPECESLLERVGLAHAARRRVGTYSKGMRQRLGLAQALLGEPALMLLDEPTNGLDPELRQAFYDLIRERKEAGTAVVISSHLLTELEERTDRIVILDSGRVAASGTLEELRDAAQLPVRLRVRVADGHAHALAGALGGSMATVDDDGTVVVDCMPEDKMPLLRHLLGLDGVVTDVAIEPPGLDAVYARFTGAAAAEDEPPTRPFGETPN